MGYFRSLREGSAQPSINPFPERRKKILEVGEFEDPWRPLRWVYFSGTVQPLAWLVSDRRFANRLSPDGDGGVIVRAKQEGDDRRLERTNGISYCKDQRKTAAMSELESDAKQSRFIETLWDIW